MFMTILLRERCLQMAYARQPEPRRRPQLVRVEADRPDRRRR